MGTKDWNYGPDQRNQHDDEDFGEKIQNLVEGAIESVDFNGLSEKIKSAIEEAVPRVQQFGQDWQDQMEANRQRVYEQRKEEQKRMEAMAVQATKRTPVMRPREVLPVYRELPGRYSGPMAIAFGSMGLVASAAMLVSSAVGMMVSGGTFATIALGASSLVTAGFAFLTGKGVQLQKKVKRYLKYQNIWKSKTHVAIKDIHDKTGISEKQIKKDLHTIVDSKLLPVSYIDEQETCIILDEQVYQQYQDAEAGRKAREKEQERRRLEEEALQSQPDHVKLQKQIEKEEEYFLREIEARKQAIASDDIRQKIDVLKDMVERIYICVKQYPDQYGQIQRMRDYYLPTMIKLLGTYAQVERQPIQKDNILKTKSEIEKSLDMINQAMEVMYDDLFRDVAMDTSADISVLETMLSRDGWKAPELKAADQGPGPLVF